MYLERLRCEAPGGGRTAGYVDPHGLGWPVPCTWVVASVSQSRATHGWPRDGAGRLDRIVSRGHVRRTGGLAAEIHTVLIRNGSPLTYNGASNAALGNNDLTGSRGERI